MKSILPRYSYMDKNCIRSTLGFNDFDWMRDDFVMDIQVVCPVSVRLEIPKLTLLLNDFRYDSNQWCHDNCQHYWSDSAILQPNNMTYYIWMFSDTIEAMQFKLAIL